MGRVRTSQSHAVHLTSVWVSSVSVRHHSLASSVNTTKPAILTPSAATQLTTTSTALTSQHSTVRDVATCPLRSSSTHRWTRISVDFSLQTRTDSCRKLVSGLEHSHSRSTLVTTLNGPGSTASPPVTINIISWLYNCIGLTGNVGHLTLDRCDSPMRCKVLTGSYYLGLTAYFHPSFVFTTSKQQNLRQFMLHFKCKHAMCTGVFDSLSRTQRCPVILAIFFHCIVWLSDTS